MKTFKQFTWLLPLLLLGLFGCGSGDGDPEPVYLVGGQGGNGAGDLYVLNDATGEVIGYVDTSATCGGLPCEIGRIRSSVYHPGSGTLIVGMGGGGSPFCNGCIVQIDLSTGVGTILWNKASLQSAIGGLFSVDAVPGMTIDGAGNLYATVKEGEGGPVALVSFTVSTPPVLIGLTGVAATVGTSYDLGNPIALVPGGSMYYATGAGLSTIDRSTGVATYIGALSFAGFGVLTEDDDFSRLNSLVRLPSGDFVGIYDDNSAGSYFGVLNVNTRVFSTTAFYGGDSTETRYGFTRLGGLSTVPQSKIRDKILPLP